MKYNWKVGEEYSTVNGSKRKIIAINENFSLPLLTINPNLHYFDTIQHYQNGKVINGLVHLDLIPPREERLVFIAIEPNGHYHKALRTNHSAEWMSNTKFIDKTTHFKQTYYKDHETGKWVFEKCEEYQP